MSSIDELVWAVFLTVIITSLFWGLIWSISTTDRLKEELRKNKK